MQTCFPYNDTEDVGPMRRRDKVPGPDLTKEPPSPNYKKKDFYIICQMKFFFFYSKNVVGQVSLDFFLGGVGRRRAWTFLPGAWFGSQWPWEDVTTLVFEQFNCHQHILIIFGPKCWTPRKNLSTRSFIVYLLEQQSLRQLIARMLNTFLTCLQQLSSFCCDEIKCKYLRKKSNCTKGRKAKMRRESGKRRENKTKIRRTWKYYRFCKYSIFIVLRSVGMPTSVMALAITNNDYQNWYFLKK